MLKYQHQECGGVIMRQIITRHNCDMNGMLGHTQTGRINDRIKLLN